MKWPEWYNRFAKYYHILDGASIDYSKFAKKLNLLFKKWGIRSILDFACGIGLLDIELEKLGYEVVGVDLSEAMLKEAKFNAKRYNSKIKFLKGDPRSSIIGKFDVILCTYNYIGHFSKEELKQILKNFKNNLKTNGFIFFDIFNFKFMLKNFKTGKFIDVARKHNDIIVVRFNKNRLDRKNKIMKIHQTTFIQQGNKLKEYKDRWNLQIYTKEDLEEMLTPDFEIVDTFGSIFGEDLFCPYSDEKECIVIFAKKIIE